MRQSISIKKAAYIKKFRIFTLVIKCDLAYGTSEEFQLNKKLAVAKVPSFCSVEKY